MDIVFLVGRILFVAVFLASGIGHFAAREAMVGYAKAYRAPSPDLTVPETGVMLLAGSASVVLGAFADLGALLFVAFLIPTTFFMHAYWKESDPQAKQMQQVQFNKNLSLLGGALILFYLCIQLQGDAGLMLTDPLFGRG